MINKSCHRKCDFFCTGKNAQVHIEIRSLNYRYNIIDDHIIIIELLLSRALVQIGRR